MLKFTSRLTVLPATSARQQQKSVINNVNQGMNMYRASLAVCLLLASVFGNFSLAQGLGSGALPPGAVPNAGTGERAGGGYEGNAATGGMSGIPRPTITNRQSDGFVTPPEERPKVSTAPVEPEPPNEFQQFVAVSLGRMLPLFGYNLFEGTAPSTFAPVDRVPVTPDYVLGAGDEIVIRAWGQVDIDYRARIDRNGQIHIPQIGTLTVGGLRYQDLHGFMHSAIARVFRNFDMSVNLGQLRSIQIFVVGQARRPGAYTVSSLSTLVNALFASGGPSSKGSMRRVQLKRGNAVVSEFDVYELLLNGDKSKDTRLLPGDVLYIPPIGDLVAIAGSVNQPAIYELKPGTSLDDLIQLAGGLSAVAEGQKVKVERITDRRVRTVAEFSIDKNGLSQPLQNGDVVQVIPLSPRFDNAITLRGSVALAGRYPWREGMRVRDLIPDRNALVTTDYWHRLNTAARQPRLGDARAKAEDVRARLEEQRKQAEDPRAPMGDRAATDEQRAKLEAQRKAEEQRKADEQRGIEEPRLPKADELRVLAEDLRFRTEVKQRFEEVNWDYAVIERLNKEELTTQLVPFNLGRALEADPSHNLLLRPGDVVTIFSKADIQVPLAKQTKFIRLEGEVVTPGVYQALPGETLRQLVARIGGFTRNAYLYGSEFTRESVRIQQQKRLDEAVDRLAQEVERSAAGRSQSGVDTPENVRNQVESQRRLVARLREVKAQGRIVLEIDPSRAGLRDLPDVALEDGDRFLVPPRPSTVSVIGAVYNQTSFVYDSNKRVPVYLDQAGGATRTADTGRLHVVRADGSVTGRVKSSIFNPFPSEKVYPGDTIVVPENLDRFFLTRELKDWSQILYQFALGVAGLAVLKNF
jgi:polysaccharide export outer membrane protein